LLDHPIAIQEWGIPMQWSDRVGRRLKLRDLHILLAVAKYGSMGKAAADLTISQPSVSKAIAEVEHAIGLRLLDRGPRGIEPTIYGRALLECGVAVFDELRRGVKRLEFLTDPAAGELRIGCTETMAAGFVAAVIDRLSRQYPRAVFHLVPADRDTLLSREMRQRTIELAVASTNGLALEGDADVEGLFDDQFVVMAGSQTKWTRRRKVTLADLLDEPWVLPPPDSLPGRYIAEAFRASGLQPPFAHLVSFSIPLHYHLLATGRFITMLPRSMLRFGKHVSLKLLPVESPAGPYPTGIITLKNRTLSPLAQLFIACAREVAKPLAKRRAAS
jgi:DNA-binding transcriptional LysR family regulator